MNTQEQPSYSDLCEALAAVFSKPETSADGKTRTYTFTPKSIRLTATVTMPPIEEVRQAIMDVMAEKENHVKL